MLEFSSFRSNFSLHSVSIRKDIFHVLIVMKFSVHVVAFKKYYKSLRDRNAMLDRYKTLRALYKLKTVFTFGPVSVESSTCFTWSLLIRDKNILYAARNKK